MPLRIRWLNVSPFDKASLKALQSGFAKLEYSDKRPRGFSHVSLERARLRGQYVERFDFLTEVQDPFGVLLEVRRIEFATVCFAFGIEPPVIEVVNPPRSLGTFFNSIAQILSFEVVIQPVEVDLAAWLKNLATSLDSVTVSGASIGEIALSNSVNASISMSGTSDVRSLMKTFVGELPNVILRLQLSGTFRSLPFKCELFKDARATIHLGPEEELSALLRKTLP